MNDWKQWASNKLLKIINEPEWLVQSRKSGLSQLNQLGLPTRSQELWKYSSLKRLEQASNIQLSTLDLITNNDCVQLVINNDSYEVLNNNDKIIINQFNEMEESCEFSSELNQDRSFSALNQAVMNQGFSIKTPTNSKIKLKVSFNQSNENWNVVRLNYELGKNAELELVEEFASTVVMNQVNHFLLNNDSRLKLHTKRNTSNNAIILNHNVFDCQKNTHIKQMVQNNQGRFVHAISDVYFHNEHSEYQAAIANVSVNDSQICENIHVYHQAKNCKSNAIQRSLADDKSQVTVNAKAIVNKGCDGSDVAQSLKNILLSDEARVHSKPELEINTDEVVAAHGSTIGELDDTALNYLRSRGIGKKQAKRMLIDSFLQDANLFKQDDFLESLNF